MVLFSNMSMGSNDFSSVVANGIINDILAKAGASNAFASASKTTFADLSKEKVAATDVDAVVVISYNDPDPAAYAKKLLKEFPSGRPPRTTRTSRSRTRCTSAPATTWPWRRSPKSCTRTRSEPDHGPAGLPAPAGRAARDHDRGDQCRRGERPAR